ncbi:MAG TPA: class I SAM-dependent methyltransferase [Stellaceae bacterium]|nr:class I SAM-dependent methyltransferase [Stellaceae bacterium]
MSDPPPAARKVVLHVGCGFGGGRLHSHFQESEWREIRLDIDPGVRPDIVASMTSMEAVAGNTIDGIWSSHNLEHLHHHEVALALGEFFRVLKPRGLLLLALPDLQRIAELVAADRLDDTAYMSPSGPITPLDMIFGHSPSLARGNHFMAHKTGFTPTTLLKALVHAGFVDILLRRGNDFDLWGRAYKPAARAD